MDAATRAFDELIRESGLVLIRQTRHSIYRAPDGRKFTCSRPHGRCGSDPRTTRNRLASLRRFLKLIDERRNGCQKEPHSPASSPTSAPLT